MHKDIRAIVKYGYEKGDYAGHFRINTQPDEREKKFLDHLVSLVPKFSKILDFGCGIGVPFDKYLSSKGLQLTGIDVSSKHLGQAKKNVPTATFIEGDFSTMDFGHERFHAIIAMYSVFHIPREEQQDLFNKMKVMLEEGGAILITLGTSNSEGKDENWTGAPMAWSNYSPPIYKKMLDQAGFEIIEDEYEGRPGDTEYHWWVLAKKK